MTLCWKTHRRNDSWPKRHFAKTTFRQNDTLPNMINFGRNFNESRQKRHFQIQIYFHLDRAKRIWYLSPMRAAKVQASLRIRAVSPEPPLLAHTGSESRGTFRQKIRSLAPLNGWACAFNICHDGMLEDTNSLDGAHLFEIKSVNVKLLITSSPKGNDRSPESNVPRSNLISKNSNSSKL